MSTAVQREASQAAPSDCLILSWDRNLNRPSSVMEVLKIYASNFLLVSGHLNACAIDYRVFQQPDVKADESILRRFDEALCTVKLDCDDLKFEHVPDFLFALERKRSFGPLTYSELAEAARNIFTIYQSELRKRLFIFISADRSAYFCNTDLFGNAVSQRFPLCTQDIQDAGTCYALDQDTACVMHLMRVLEVSLVELAIQFPGVATDRKEWNTIIESIEKKVRSIGPQDGVDWREKRDSYSDICSQFMHFKNAWRNHAMHARSRYNGREAVDILDHVRQFMQHLSIKL